MFFVTNQHKATAYCAPGIHQIKKREKVFTNYQPRSQGLFSSHPLKREGGGRETLGIRLTNRPFPNSLVPLFQNESKCETFLMKMSSACSFIFMQIKVIFIRMVCT